MKNNEIAKFLLRLGIAFVFSYAAISMSLDPTSFLHYVPVFVTKFIPAELFLHIFGVFEIVISAWLLWGKWNQIPAAILTATILGLTIVNFDSFSVLFRNVTIFFAGLALIVLNKEK